MMTTRAAAKSAPMQGNADHNLLTVVKRRVIACQPTQRLERMRPESVRTPIRNPHVAIDAGKAVENSASRDVRDDGAGEAMLRRRARRLALLLMVLSGVFMIALAVGAWLLLRG